jgi:cell division protein FtsQ
VSEYSGETRAPINLLANALYAGAALLLGYALLIWLVSLPAFALRHVDVRGALKQVDEAQVRLVASRGVYGNFFTVDLDKVRGAFEKLPWVSEARVTRQWPDRLIVEVREHQPLGVWNRQQLVSTDGEVFAAKSVQALPGLSGMDGTAVEVSVAYGKFSAMLAPLGLKIQELSLSPRRAWRLKTVSETDVANTLEIVLGRKDAEARLARFAGQYVNAVERLGAAPAYADLRYADGFALRQPRTAPSQAVNLNERSQS